MPDFPAAPQPEGPELAGLLAECLDRYRAALSALRTAEEDVDRAGEQLARDALCYQLVVLAETVASLPEELRAEQPGIPWGRLLILRHEVGRLPRIGSTTVRSICNEALAELQYHLPDLRAIPGIKSVTG
ncbi:MAG: hypothetical protein ACOYEV_13440 [Candidatus Nanopelagicales bacterium]